MMHFLRRARTEKSLPRTPGGYRAYAVGDVHGRLDLLEDMLRRIEADLNERQPKRAILLFLGDLIDRGPASCQVIERLRTYAHPRLRTLFLMGNHEEVLLRLLAAERGILDSWLRFGGTECLASYGVDASAFKSMSEREALAAVKRAIPESHRKFITDFADTARFGDYLFVHAGIRPAVDISMQSQADLRWIRQPFLDDDSDHGFVIVHGHTISDAVVERPNRIGIDTGAYRTGILSALVLEGEDRRFLTSRLQDGTDSAPD
jgi:serine/threonine protein phosphatase 1